MTPPTTALAIAVSNSPSLNDRQTSRTQIRPFALRINPEKGTDMAYLFFELWYWALLALAIGFLTGWLVCSGRDDQDTTR
jgi:bacteriorhodopsin